MLLVVLGWLAAAATLLGVGLALARWARAEPLDPGQAFWVGWAGALCALQVVQLAVPVGWPVAVALALVGAAGWASAWRWLRLPTRPPWLEALLGGALAVALAVRAQAPSLNGDSGVYHRPAVRWMADAALPAGLANLNPLLGLNSAHALFQAALDVGPWAHLSQHVGPSLLVLVLGLQSLHGAALILRAPASAGARAWLALLFAPLVVDLALGRDLSSDAPDLAVAVVGAALWIELVTWVEVQGRAALPTGLLLLAVGMGIACKLSYAAWGLAVGLAVLIFGLARHPERRARTAVLAVAVFLGTVGVWSVRSLVMTGYPLYPSPWLSLPVSWRLPQEVVDRVQRYVLVWGRWSGGPRVPVLGTWSWVRPWLVSAMSMNRALVVPVALAVLCLALGVWRRRSPLRSWWLLLPVVAALAFWFATSPDVRFAGALIWALPATAAWLALRPATASPGFQRGLVVVVLALALEPLSDPLRPVAWAWLRPPRSAEVPAVMFRTDSGLEVRVPVGGACWDLPVPCTSFPRSGLALRGQALSQGFVWGGPDRPLPPGVPSATIPDVH
ncbi:MAG: hypothetical protein JST54_15840 [Deltaproteobacteria bacterium]|nr:hypothetical protein [Deltaproteobacteria bacterium]